MTSNQINYMNYLETVRSNTVQQAEAIRHNKAWEAETARHNLESENISLIGLKEAHRHNLMSEKIGLFDVNERARHNKETEKQRQIELYEAHRHNVIGEALTRSQIGATYASIRSNERIAKMKDKREADRNHNDYQRIKQRDFELVTDRKRADEAVRHNKASEGLQYQHNQYSLAGSLINAAANLMKII